MLHAFGVRVSMTFHRMCVHISFSSVWVAEWSPFGKELLTRFTICPLCVFTTVCVHLARRNYNIVCVATFFSLSVIPSVC